MCPPSRNSLRKLVVRAKTCDFRTFGLLFSKILCIGRVCIFSLYEAFEFAGRDTPPVHALDFAYASFPDPAPDCCRMHLKLFGYLADRPKLFVMYVHRKPLQGSVFGCL